MPAPFAAREARVNAAVVRHLANVDGTYTPVGGVVYPDPVQGIFDNAYTTVNGDGVSSTTPAISTNVADVPSPARGDTWVIHGITYTVVECMPDGAGMTVQRLRK